MSSELSMHLGELRGSLSGLRDGVSEIKQELVRSREDREELAGMVDRLTGRVDQLGAQMVATSKTVDDLRGQITPLADLKKNAAGMVLAGSAVLSVVSWLFGDQIRELVTRALHLHP